MVENLVAIELAYINTKHPDFHKDAAFVSSLLKNTDIDKYNRKVPSTSSNSVSGIAIPTENNKKMHAQQNHWLLSNLLPQERTESVTSAEGSPIRNSGNISPQPNLMLDVQKSSPQQKPVNLLPEVPMQTSRKLSEREQRDCDVIERLIKSYFYIVRKSIQDSVPKAVMHFLVNFVKDNLQSELVTHLYKSDQAEALLNESEHIAIRRKEASDMLKALTQAGHIISEIRETHMW